MSGLTTPTQDHTYSVTRTLCHSPTARSTVCLPSRRWSIFNTPWWQHGRLIGSSLPGGQFIGSVGHLLPYLEGMHYNHTHRGVVTTLETAGFDVQRLMAPTDWSALEAMAELGLFPAMPTPLARTAVKPVDWLSRLWWWLGSKVRPNRSDANEMVRLASFFFFVASKAE